MENKDNQPETAWTPESVPAEQITKKDQEEFFGPTDKLDTKDLNPPPAPPAKQVKLTELIALIFKRYRTTFIIIGIILVLFAGFSIWFYINTTNNQNTALDNDAKIRSSLFNERQRALEYYKSTKTYKDWEAKEQVKTDLQAIGSDIVVLKPDYQSFVIYAPLLSTSTYFCLDSFGYVGEVTTVYEKQYKCR